MEGIHSTMAEFAIAVEIVLGPNDGDFPMFQHFRIPDSLQPGIFARAHAFYKFLVGRGGGCSVRTHGKEHGFRSEERLSIGRIVRGHVVKEALRHCEWAARLRSATAG